MASHTVAITFVRSALQIAQRQGLDIRHALQTARITPELIGRDGTRVTPQQAIIIVQALLEATDDELLGAGPRRIPRGTFRMISLGLIHSADLRTAMQRLVEFTRIGTGFDAVSLSDDGTTTRISIGPVGETSKDQIVIDVLIAVTHRFAGWLIGEQIALQTVELPYSEPPHSGDYPLIYGIRPEFESRTAAMTFDSHYLAAPIIRDEDALLEFIRRSPADLFFRRDYSPTVASRVRKALERGRSGEWLTTEDVAKRLAISSQHLRRLLRDEKTSFREIKEQILRDEAIASLVRGTETIEELSDRLGFSEPSAFRRAFRRWTGSPPGSYRPDAS